MGQVGASETFSMGLEPYPRHFENKKSGEPRESKSSRDFFQRFFLKKRWKYLNISTHIFSKISKHKIKNDCFIQTYIVQW